MFRDVLKILRALFGAVALMGIIGGGFFVDVQAAAEPGDGAVWSARKNAKPAVVSASRSAVACPLAVSAKAAAGRAVGPAPAVSVSASMIFAWIEKARSGAAAHGARREPEREPVGRARQGVVRLLI